MELLRTLEARAAERLDAATYGYFAGGAGDELTLAENVQAWERLWLVPRHGRGIAAADTAVALLGARSAAPVVLAPVAAQRLLHPDGELAVARAAAAAGVGMCVSTRATTDLATVAAAGPSPRWFQLYLAHDRDASAAVLARLPEHGYSHVVLTLDLPVAGRRERDRRLGPVAMPDGVRIVSHLGAHADAAGATAKPEVGGWSPVGWEDVAWVAGAAGLPVIVKGVLSAHDAERAIAAGAAAIVVSNHGARQLDGCVPTAVALGDVARAVDGRVPVLVDGGVRDGADVVRALALGACAVLVGRPYLWGLVAGGPDGTGGEAGVAEVLTELLADLERTLVLCGAASCAEVGRHHVRPRRP